VKYARTRHYRKGAFTYCRLESLGEIEELLKSQIVPDHGQAGQVKIWSSNRLNSSLIHEIDAGPMGFEPMTFSLEGKTNIDLKSFREYLTTKYSRQYVSLVYGYSVKYSAILENPQKLSEIPISIRGNVLKAIVALSKYLGIYEDFTLKLKQFGIHWSNGDNSFNAFMRITNNNHSSLGLWYKEVQTILRENERLYLRFTLLTGIRKSESQQAFNMIIDLAKQNKLGDFYNSDIQALEFYKHPQFNRRTKKVYLSFIDSQIIQQIANSSKVSYYAIRKRLTLKKQNSRIKELRSYFATYLRQNSILPEIVDLVQGRLEAKNIQLSHYFKIADMNALSSQVLAVTSTMERDLLS